jgi:hypothetical protein
MTTSPHIRSL